MAVPGGGGGIRAIQVRREFSTPQVLDCAHKVKWQAVSCESIATLTVNSTLCGATSECSDTNFTIVNSGNRRTPGKQLFVDDTQSRAGAL